MVINGLYFQQESSSMVTDPSLSSSWPVRAEMESSQSTHLSFGSPVDRNKLDEARMLISGMDYGRTTEQDEDGDT